MIFCISCWIQLIVAKICKFTPDDGSCQWILATFAMLASSQRYFASEHLNQKDHMIFLTFCQNKVLSWPSWIIGVMDKRSNAHPELPLAPLPPSYSFRPAAMLLGPCFFFFFASATLTNCLPQLHTPFTSSCILHLVGCTASTDFFYPANFLSVMLLKDI